MKARDFETLVSTKRFERYKIAMRGNTRKAMTLYRYNLQLSQELFSIISIFEIVLRNKIDAQVGRVDWLRDAAIPHNIFHNNKNKTYLAIMEAYDKLTINDKTRLREPLRYNHSELLTKLSLGFWTKLFQRIQHRAIQHTYRKDITDVFHFPTSFVFGIDIHGKPISKRVYIQNQLSEVNKIRNRIAHHEPICFNARRGRYTRKDTYYILNKYNVIIDLLKYMQVDVGGLLYGIDHVQQICNKIDCL